MNSCLCEHQPLWARSWPATTLLLLSSGEEPAFLLILLQRKLPGNVVPVIIVSVFLGKCRRKYSTHSMCSAMRVSQQTRDENLHGHLRVTPKLRPNHQVSQASDAALRNCGDQDRSADSIRTVPGGVGLHTQKSEAIPQLLLPPAGTGEELFVDWVKSAGSAREKPWKLWVPKFSGHGDRQDKHTTTLAFVLRSLDCLMYPRVLSHVFLSVC